MRNVAYGCLAGLAATIPMTASMRRLHEFLPKHQRYALPPGEILAAGGGPEGPSAALLAHFAYGGLIGALFALQRRRSAFAGSAFGVAVWCASYLGWIPALRFLAPATRHPRRRNALMLAAHLVWGAALASGLREIERAEPAFSRRGKPLRDIPNGRRAVR